MRVGIFGKAGAGKSTLLRALAGSEAHVAAGKGGGVCTVKVPDERIDRLSALYRPKKTTYISITFVDIDPGEESLLPPETQAKIKGVEVLAILLRAFADDFHPAPAGGLDPVGEFREIEQEIVLADYLVAQKRIERMTKEARRDAEWAALHKVVAVLEKERPLRDVDFTGDEARILSGFRFMSQLPLMVVLNAGENDLKRDPSPGLTEEAGRRHAPVVRLSARIEEEIAELPPPEQAEFLKDLGTDRPARDQLIRGAFEAMQYICFMTVGEDEVRAWNVRKGTAAVHAAGRIHSDLEKGFIRAEVVPWDELVRCGSLARAKTEGKLRLEGKEYVVRDGEVMHVRFNV